MRRNRLVLVITVAAGIMATVLAVSFFRTAKFDESGVSA